MSAPLSQVCYFILEAYEMLPEDAGSEEVSGLGKLGKCLERNRQGAGEGEAPIPRKLKMSCLANYNRIVCTLRKR